VHGARNLRRIGIVIAYSFYKNCLLVLPMALYSVYTGFTGTTLYDSYLLMCFNIVTFLPILIVGVFDFHVPAQMANTIPSLYQLGIQGVYWNSWMLIGWLMRGIWHACLIFGTMRMLFLDVQQPQLMADYLAMGSWAFWACVAVVNAILTLHMKAWMDWLVFNIVFSVLVYLPWLMIYSQEAVANVFTPSFVGVGPCLFGQLMTWLSLVWVTSVAALVDLAITYVQREKQPTVADVLLEVCSGHLSGVDKLPSAGGGFGQGAFDNPTATSQKCTSGADSGAYGVEVFECISRLPPPPKKVFKVRPDGGMKVRPLNSECMDKKADHKFRGIVPEPSGGDSTDAQHIRSVETIPETFSDRVKGFLVCAARWVWKQQWREIVVQGDFRSGASEWDQGVKNAVTTTKGQVSTRTSLETGSTGEVVQQRPRHSSSSANSENSHNSGSRAEVVQDLVYSLLTLRFWSEDKEFAFRQYFSAQAVQLFQKSLLAFSAALLLYNLYQMVMFETARTMFRYVMCIMIGPMGGFAAYLLRSSVFQLHASPASSPSWSSSFARSTFTTCLCRAMGSWPIRTCRFFSLRARACLFPTSAPC
jgi:hypothetical protein